MAKQKKNFDKGQSLIEVIVAAGIFSLGMATVALFVLNSFGSAESSLKRNQGLFLAREGLEAVRSIRNSEFEELEETDTSYGLALEDASWSFEGSSDKTGKFTRKIKITNVSEGKKEVLSQVSWPDKGTTSRVTLRTYFTNWKAGEGDKKECSQDCIDQGYAGGSCVLPASCDSDRENSDAQYCEAPYICCCAWEVESVDEYCADTSVGEDVDESENENEDSGGYGYEYDYGYDYQNGKYRYEYSYKYVWNEDANQDPDPEPSSEPEQSLDCANSNIDIDLDPDPDPDPDPPDDFGEGSCADYCENQGYDSGTCRQNVNKCSQNNEEYKSGGDEYCTGPSENVCCCSDD